jgi:sporulation protein YlmC with PRC-barrel domain
MRLLSSTAIVLALATSFAGAQTPPPALPSTPPTMPQAQPVPQVAPRAAPGDMSGMAAMMTTIPNNAATITHWYKQAVYDQSNAKIGEIDDVLVDRDAKIVTLIVGVGGFLGIGETHVAVPYSSVQATNRDNKMHLVINTTKDALMAAPHFDYDRTAMMWKPASASTTTGAATPMMTPTPPATVTSPANPPVTAPRTAQNQPVPQNQPLPQAAPRAAPADTAVVQTMASIPANTATVTHWYKQPVYDPGDARIGEIDDVLLDRDGKVAAFIIGVGGFLGLGERHLAVPYTAVQATTKDINKYYLVMNTTKDALSRAPHFKYDRTALTWIPENATTGTSSPSSPAPRTNPPVAR